MNAALAGRGSPRPICLQKFLPFSKKVEFLADEAILWPISRIKACCGEEKQELGERYFYIDPCVELHFG